MLLRRARRGGGLTACGIIVYMKTQSADTTARIRRTSWNRLRRLAAARDMQPGVLLNQILASPKAVRAALAALDGLEEATSAHRKADFNDDGKL